MANGGVEVPHNYQAAHEDAKAFAIAVDFVRKAWPGSAVKGVLKPYDIKQIKNLAGTFRSTTNGNSLEDYLIDAVSLLASPSPLLPKLRLHHSSPKILFKNCFSDPPASQLPPKSVQKLFLRQHCATAPPNNSPSSDLTASQLPPTSLQKLLHGAHCITASLNTSEKTHSQTPLCHSTPDDFHQNCFSDPTASQLPPKSLQKLFRRTSQCGTFSSPILRSSPQSIKPIRVGSIHGGILRTRNPTL